MSGYETIARPLTELIKKNARFSFGNKEIQAFNQLKEMLCNKSVLRIYSPTADTELHTDASSYGFGAVLMQRDSEDRFFHPVYFASTKTSATEAKLHSYELEVLAVVKVIKKFRVYLIGIPFKIVTDCQAFTLTLKKSDCCAKIARWALFLQDFTYIIEHRTGNLMRHVDTLSRNFWSATMMMIECQETIATKLKRSQLDDDETKKIWEQTQLGKTDDYCISNNLLYKMINNEALIVVPEPMQPSIIRHVHDRGHFAVDKTEKLIKTDYWFQGMRPKIEKYMQNCIDCILAEKKSGKLEGWLHPIDKEGIPFGTYHIDHFGPLPSTKKKYNHIFAVVDGFTKFIWLYPVKTTNTIEVLDKLIKQSAIFGNPRRIVSDRGSTFTSHDFKEYCKDEGIEHVTVVTGLPRGNGQIERVNRTLIPLLTKLTHPNPFEWHKYVEKAQRYLNSIPNRSTGMSPFYLLSGTRMKMKEDPTIRNIIEAEEAALFQEKREQSRELARQSIIKVQEENR